MLLGKDSLLLNCMHGVPQSTFQVFLGNRRGFVPDLYFVDLSKQLRDGLLWNLTQRS